MRYSCVQLEATISGSCLTTRSGLSFNLDNFSLFQLVISTTVPVRCARLNLFREIKNSGYDLLSFSTTVLCNFQLPAGLYIRRVVQ